MKDELVINIQNLSKAYPLYEKPLDLFKEFIFGGVRHDLFWALRDISFQVVNGQRVGIIGPNGAGKSTLLQIIAGNLQPTTGLVWVDGKISALLSLVPFWRQEQSGIENIRFNLLLRGCSSADIEKLTDDIVEFAELGPFINQPIKTYSSGMSARLSFAIATAISPEILIVDEVLSAGDGYFAGKATKRMMEMCEKGKALLFVSHSTSAVRQMCDFAVWMESGSIRLSGPVDYVTAKYDEDMARRSDESIRPANFERIRKNIHFTTPDEIGDVDSVRLRLRYSESERGGKTYYISDMKITWDSANKERASLSVPLDSTADGCEVYLDLMGCEWGRLYSKGGTVSRMLAPRTGARKGGHILLKRPAEFIHDAWQIQVEWKARGDGFADDLFLEYIDMDDAVWKRFDTKSLVRQAEGWNQFTATGLLSAVTSRKREHAQNVATSRRTSPVEIKEIEILSKAGNHSTILEEEPFVVAVYLECYEKSTKFNVSLLIHRSDGVYVFWQPSDFYGQLPTSGSDRVCIRYHFDENVFSSGDYEVTVNVMSPWHLDVVQSEIEVFDRKTSFARFKVVRKYKNLQFGTLNYRARIELIKD